MPLNERISRLSHDITVRNRNTILSANAIGKIFSGAMLPENIDLDTVIAQGLYRYSVSNGNTNYPPKFEDDEFLSGYLLVNCVNPDYLESGDAYNYRQTVYADTATMIMSRRGKKLLDGTIDWTSWDQVGGYGGYNVVFVDDDYQANVNDLVVCCKQGITVTLPNGTDKYNKAKVRISTMEVIPDDITPDEINPVVVKVAETEQNVYIGLPYDSSSELNNITEVEITTDYSTIELAYKEDSSRWCISDSSVGNVVDNSKPGNTGYKVVFTSNDYTVSVYELVVCLQPVVITLPNHADIEPDDILKIVTLGNAKEETPVIVRTDSDDTIYDDIDNTESVNELKLDTVYSSVELSWSDVKGQWIVINPCVGNAIDTKDVIYQQESTSHTDPSTGDTTYIGVDAVVEWWTSSDESKWYRLWKSGFLEQGGITSIPTGYILQTVRVNLPKEYNDTKYFIKTTPYAKIRQETCGMCDIVDFTTNSSIPDKTGFNVFTCNKHYSKFSWYTCGYVTPPED